ADDPDLHAFPTRRSSDLDGVARDLDPGRAAKLVIPEVARLPCRIVPQVQVVVPRLGRRVFGRTVGVDGGAVVGELAPVAVTAERSEEHTSELQSRENLVC